MACVTRSDRRCTGEASRSPSAASRALARAACELAAMNGAAVITAAVQQWERAGVTAHAVRCEPDSRALGPSRDDRRRSETRMRVARRSARRGVLPAADDRGAGGASDGAARVERRPRPRPRSRRFVRHGHVRVRSEGVRRVCADATAGCTYRPGHWTRVTEVDEGLAGTQITLYSDFQSGGIGTRLYALRSHGSAATWVSKRSE